MKDERLDRILETLNENERQKKDDQYMDFLPQLDFKNEQKNIKHLMK